MFIQSFFFHSMIAMLVVLCDVFCHLFIIFYSYDARRDFWRALKKTVAANINWRCERCGYQTGDFVWQCHNCLSWESFRRAPL